MVLEKKTSGWCLFLNVKPNFNSIYSRVIHLSVTAKIQQSDKLVETLIKFTESGFSRCAFVAVSSGANRKR